MKQWFYRDCVLSNVIKTHHHHRYSFLFNSIFFPHTLNRKHCWIDRVFYIVSLIILIRMRNKIFLFFCCYQASFYKSLLFFNVSPYFFLLFDVKWLRPWLSIYYSLIIQNKIPNNFYFICVQCTNTMCDVILFRSPCDDAIPYFL